MSDIKNIIDNAARAYAADGLASEYKGGVWGDLRKTAIGHTDAEYWMAELLPAENEYMEEHFADEPLAKKRDGSWKYRAFKDADGNQVVTLPPEYVSAKSVVKGCIEQGIDVALDMGKSEAQRLIREAKEAASPASAYDKVKKYLSSIESNWSELSISEQENVKEFIYNL